MSQVIDQPNDDNSNNNSSDSKPTNKDKTVTLHVSGASYELDMDSIRRCQSSRLYSCVFAGNSMSLSFQRPVQCFESVLAYYQTGELHMPMSVCPGAFKTELEFWGIDPQIMSKCCYYRYMAHQDDQETLDKFHKHLFPEVGIEKRPLRWAKDFRSKLWRVVDNTDRNLTGKLYFYICTAMVLLSVMTLACSTLPYFRRNLTSCELEIVLGQPLKTVDGFLGNDSCFEPVSDEVYSIIITHYDKINVTRESDLKKGDIIVSDTGISTENGTAKEPNSPTQRISPQQARTLFDFNFDNEDTVSDETLFEHVFDALRPRVGIGKKTARIKMLVYLDVSLLAFFTADLLMRILSCPSIRQYFLSSINVIDAIVVLSAYAHMLINFLKSSEQYESTYVDILEVFQVFRVVRLLRVVRHVIGFKVLTFSLKVSLNDLLVLFLYLLLGIAIFANFIFFVESDNDIESIPAGWWWAINTLTTVGYGDMVPYTMYGRLIGALCAISGIVLMAVAIPVFVKTFLLLYAYAVLYKKGVNKPEESHRFIHRQGAIRSQRNNDQ